MPGTQQVLQKEREVVGYYQITAGNMDTAVGIPGHGNVVMIQAEAQDVRYRLDGTNPTTAVGMYLADKVVHTINIGRGNEANIKVIGTVANAILNITWFD
jgi:hypothetical protein